MPRITADQRRLLHEALDASLDQPGMDQGNFHEVRDFLAAPWTPSAKPLGYIENLELRLPLLEQLRDMEFRTPKGHRKIPPELWTSNVWAALMVADYNKLKAFVEECQESAHDLVEASTIFNVLDRSTITVIDVGLYPRRITTSRPSTPVSAPTKAPTVPSTPTRKRPGDDTSAPSTPRKKSTRSPAQPNPPSLTSPINDLPRNQRERATAHERDRGKCTVTKSMEPEVMHFFPHASIKYAWKMFSAWGPFKRFIPKQEWDDYLTIMADETDILDTARNMISMDHVIHHRIDQGHIGLQPIAVGPNSVTLRLRFLPASKLSPKNQGQRAWKNNPAQSPGDILIPRVEQYQPGVEQQLRIVHNETQRLVKDGHEFTITAEDPGLLPDFRLLQVQWRIACMANLSGRAGDDDLVTLGEPDCDPDQETAPMAGDSGDLAPDDEVPAYMLSSENDDSN